MDRSGAEAETPVEEGAAEEEVSVRQREILAIVGEQGFATVEALARRFGVSAQTVRRDIIRLDEAGLLERFHGGAGARGRQVRLGYAEKRQISADAKERIGQAVAAMVPDGASVFLDVGTTVEAVARALKPRRGLRVFTSSLQAALIFADHPAAEVFVAGGLMGGPDGSLVGDATTAALARFRVDLAVVGFSGFDEDGAPMDFDMRKVAVKQAALAACRRGVLVGDSSKFARSAIVRVVPPSAVGTLVTDAEPPEGLAALLRAAGVSLVVA